MKEVCECRSPIYFLSRALLPLTVSMFLVLTTGAVSWPVVILAYLSVDTLLGAMAPAYSKASAFIAWILVIIAAAWFYFLGTIVIY